MNNPTSEITQRLEAHKAEHAKYSKARLNKIMEEFAKKKTGIAFLVPDELSTRCVYFTDYKWTDEAATAYLASGTIPAKLTDFKDMPPVCMVFARIWAVAPVSHDLGIPGFLHVTHCTDSKIVYVIEGVGQPQAFRDNFIFFVPSEYLDTPELKRSNEEYLRTGIKTQVEVKPKNIPGLPQTWSPV